MKDRRVATVQAYLQSVITLYTSCSFIVDTIFGNHKFEVLCPWHPNLNITVADEHIQDIERHLLTIKDSTWSTYHTLPFCQLPHIALVH